MNNKGLGTQLGPRNGSLNAPRAEKTFKSSYNLRKRWTRAKLWNDVFQIQVNKRLAYQGCAKGVALMELFALSSSRNLWHTSMASWQLLYGGIRRSTTSKSESMWWIHPFEFENLLTLSMCGPYHQICRLSWGIVENPERERDGCQAHALKGKEKGGNEGRRGAWRKLKEEGNVEMYLDRQEET